MGFSQNLGWEMGIGSPLQDPPLTLALNFVLVPSTFKILYSLELMGRISFTLFTRSFVLTSRANLFRKLAIVCSRMSSILKFARAFKTRNYLSCHGT